MNGTNIQLKLLAGMLALGLATAASAQTLVGGGATLPALGYTGDVTHRQVTPVSGSLLAAYSAQPGNKPTSYCQTGSGAGKNILAGVAGNNVQNACPDGSATPTGFGAAAVGRTDLTQPDFAAADSPLSAADYNNYVSNRPTSKPVQFPAVAGAVAIAFNKVDDQGTRLTSLKLADSQICSIFSGSISSWNDSRLASALSLPAGHTISGPINLVYRSDGSGTTFSLANHLAAACAPTASASFHFVTDQTFTNVVAKLQPTLPSNWVGQSGNPAVANQICQPDATGACTSTGNGNLGYVEFANAASTKLSFATVNGISPLTFGAAKVPVSVVFNQVINGADATTGKPLLAAISPAPSTQCVALVDPSTYAQPTSGYPIVAVSYLLANANNNGTSDAWPVRLLLGAPYNATIQSATTRIGKAGTGLAFLTPPSSITQAGINNCIVN